MANTRISASSSHSGNQKTVHGISKGFNSTFAMAAVGFVVVTLIGILSKNMAAQIIFAVVYLIALFIVMKRLSKALTNPIGQLVGMLRELRLGHLNAHASFQSFDELVLLSRELNAFAYDVRDNILGNITKIANGDVSMNVKKQDAGDMIAPAMAQIIDRMKSLSDDTEYIIEHARRGELDVRGNTDAYSGSWQYLMESINSLIDSITKPTEEVMAVMKSLAVNDYTKKISGTYSGAFAELASNVNGVRDNLLAMQGAVVRISQGDTSKLEDFRAIGKRSENDYMTPSIVRLMETLQALIEEIRHITEEAKKGNIFHNHADADKFEGGYREIMAGINSILDVQRAPIEYTEHLLHNVSVNDFSEKIDSGSMNGDYRVLGDALRQVQEQLMRMQEIAVKASMGDVSSLDEVRARGVMSEQDQLTPAFIKMLESIQGLIDETTALAAAAEEGRLDYRSATTKCEGEFATLLNSFNRAFHHMAKPIKEIGGVMGEFAQGNLNVRVEGDYKGAFANLADVVNGTIGTLKAMLEQVSDSLTAVASGNLAVEAVADYEGDFAVLSGAMNTIVDNFNELIDKIITTSEEVAAGSKQVAEGSQNLSQGATEQASSVEQLTASIAEIAQRTKENAGNAAQANKLAAVARENALGGNHHMDDMLEAMNKINESSKSISKIIKVIDDIAFQTNILALNAAVEAARAGQYGKGFAVVAEEVRNLAARSANAVKETTDLIEGSMNRTQAGLQIANDTAAAFSTIAGNIDSVANLVAEIASSSSEQATGISQIDQGVEVVSNVVQTNSATAEQSAAASEELSSQAENLKQMLAQFTIRTQAAEGTEPEAETEAEAAAEAEPEDEAE